MERPILFNTDMVKAILSGQKTQTRRIVKPQPNEGYRLDRVEGKFLRTKEFKDRTPDDEYIGTVVGQINPPYLIGDTLWVRETWSKIEDFKNYTDLEIDKDLEYLYKCDDNGKEHSFIDVGVQKWHPSIHMPRSAARLFLKVTGARVERLQDITEEDAKKEGFEDGPCLEALDIFESTWNGIYGNWNDNPWVWVIEFERVCNDGNK